MAIKAKNYEAQAMVVKTLRQQRRAMAKSSPLTKKRRKDPGETPDRYRPESIIYV